MSVTVYWTEDDTEHSEELAEPVMVAAVMATVEQFDNLTPAGWSWCTDREYEDVLILRDGRPYTARPYVDVTERREAGRPHPGPWVWISVWRSGVDFHDVRGEDDRARTTCDRPTNTTGMGQFVRRGDVEGSMKPCPRCYRYTTQDGEPTS